MKTLGIISGTALATKGIMVGDIFSIVFGLMTVIVNIIWGEWRR